MSNMEREPGEVVLDARPDVPSPVSLLDARDVPLGGPRAMHVRRTLPSRERTMIGAWCFLDHYGPEEVERTGGMRVPPHPHTGLQTVSWLFAGRIRHRDSVGSDTIVEPGAVNLMTAGRGISHSETSTAESHTLHGVQLWVALPDSHRFVDPFFEHAMADPVEHDGATVRVFVGALPLPGTASPTPVTTFTPLVAAQIDLPAGSTITLPLDWEFEHGVLVDTGTATVDAVTTERFQLAYLPPERDQVSLAAGGTDARLVLIGGTPLPEQIVMWWNFVGRSHEEIVRFREEWQQQIAGEDGSSDTFGMIPPGAYDGQALPAPAMPGVRLRPRNR